MSSRRYGNAVNLKMEMLIPERIGMNFIDFALCKLDNLHTGSELSLHQKV